MGGNGEAGDASRHGKSAEVVGLRSRLNGVTREKRRAQKLLDSKQNWIHKGQSPVETFFLSLPHLVDHAFPFHRHCATFCVGLPSAFPRSATKPLQFHFSQSQEAVDMASEKDDLSMNPDTFVSPTVS